jgi:thiol-disulfide isomerase/thioredoxin
MRFLLALLLIALASPRYARGGGGSQEVGSESVKERFESLEREYDAKKRASLAAAERGTTDEEKEKIVAATYPDDGAYAKRFLALAHQETSGPVAIEARGIAIQLGGHGPEAQAAIRELRQGFSADTRMQGVIQQIALSPCLEVEVLLREVLAKTPDRTTRGLSCQGLANLLDSYANLPRLREQDAAMARRLERSIGVPNLDRLALRDAEAMMREAEALHERVLADFEEVRLYPSFPLDRQTIGKASRIWLGERRETAVGSVALEIDGKAIDGKPIKLSDYRGKVVVLVFWASWCGPCMAEVPHERALAERHHDRPFTLLGVNCDQSEDDARKAITKARVTWPNWFDGNPDEGPIVARYHARSLPRIYVLDPKGVIRYKDVRGEALSKAVDDLLSKIPAAR